MKKISILGGGPAGLGVAYYAKQEGIAFELFEASTIFGGNCITLNHDGFLFDSGAHRLHDKDAETTRIFKELLQEDLELIHVPSQIYRDGQFIDFPISPLNLMRYLGIPTFIAEGSKLAWKNITSKSTSENFKVQAIQNYGAKIADLFLIGYSEKLWGMKADQLSSKIAGKRLKGLTVASLLVETILGKKQKTKHLDGAFYYPKYGIGTLFDALVEHLDTANLHATKKVTEICHTDFQIESIQVNNSQTIPVEHLVSSLPLKVFLNILSPKPPEDILKIANSIRFRNIVLVAFFLNKETINSNGSMYFPSKEFPFTRMYEPKNRSMHMAPKGKTSLIVEIPCFQNDAHWNMKNEEIVTKVKTQIFDIGFFKASDIINAEAYKIQNAYPVLEYGFEEKTAQLFQYLSKFKNLNLTGRNGLFAYTHIHDHMINARKVIQDIQGK
ncbi:MAG: FAD-dependent oxidoreductase [Bacteroidota bacterium]